MLRVCCEKCEIIYYVCAVHQSNILSLSFLSLSPLFSPSYILLIFGVRIGPPYTTNQHYPDTIWLLVIYIDRGEGVALPGYYMAIGNIYR